MDDRQKLLQTLMQDLENFQMPERYDKAQQDKIMSGRKGQKEIDEGRATIRENERLYQDAATRKAALQKQISDLRTEIDKAAAGTRRQEQEDWERSVPGQAYSIGKTVAPFGAGIYAGHKMATGIEGRQQAMDPEKLRSMGAFRRFAPYLLRGAMLAPEGYYVREHIAPEMATETGKELTQGAGNFAMWAGLGTMGEGAVKALTPPNLPNVPGGPPSLPSAPMGAPQLPQSPAPAALATSPQTPAPTPPPSFKTGVEAREYAKSKGVTLPSKISAAEAKARAEEIRATVDKAQQGSRAGKIAKGAKAVLPLAAGALAYDAAVSDAEAAGATPGEAQRQGIIEGGTAAGGTAAGAYGLSKTLNKFPALGRAVSGAGAMMAPMLAADAYDPSPEKLAMDRNELARILPEWLQFGAIGKARDMAQVPGRNPMRRLPPAPMGFGGPY